MKTMQRKAARPAIQRPAMAPVEDLPDLQLPPRVVAALGPQPTSAASIRTALLALALRLAARSEARDAAVVDDLVAIGLHAMQERPAVDGDFALRLSTACFTYLEHAGRHEARLRLAARLLQHVEHLPSAWSRRSMLHFAAVACLSADDPKQAWVHAERAYELASGLEASAARFEILILAVQILDSMGLLGDARNLALQLVDFPDGEPVLDTLHLVNATHGLSLCHRLDDVVAACRFHDIARTKATARLLDDATAIVVRFEAARAVHLARIGRGRAALRRLDKVMERAWPADGRRSEALLRCAQAEVHMASGVEQQMERSLVALKELLADLDPASPAHQEILRTIVKLALKRSADGDREVAMHYLHQLADQPWFATRGCRVASDLLLLNGTTPVDESACRRAARERPSTPGAVAIRGHAEDSHRRFAGFGLPWPVVRDENAALSRPELEASSRTPSYQAAEDWAVVAEIARGGDGRRCFKVGQVAAEIAAALGFSTERCVLIELGSRLRDIGHATLVRAHRGEQQHAPVRCEHEPGLVATHTNAGQRMLSFSSDPVLRLATRIARGHHAYWNGSGYPDLQGDAIPIEARICAVADTLIDLVDPIGARKPWPIERALRQMHCMAGVQLDPGLVDVLARVLTDEGSGTSDPALQWEATRAGEAFAEARKQLFEKLELAA